MREKKEPIIVYDNKSDIVIIEDVNKFPANITIGLSDLEDFYIKIVFSNLSVKDFKLLTEYANRLERIKFTSELIKREKYNITHIVITKHSENSLLDMTWECLSDDPELYNLIIE